MEKNENLTLQEAAEALRMSYQWVWERVSDGRIKGVRLGGKYFVAREEVERIKREGCE